MTDTDNADLDAARLALRDAAARLAAAPDCELGTALVDLADRAENYGSLLFVQDDMTSGDAYASIALATAFGATGRP